MAEAQPSKKKNHPYGRRKATISNTAEEGQLCIYSGHGIGRYSDSSMRYDSHQACVRCVAAAREGRIGFDIDRLRKPIRQKALKFWSQVEIRDLDSCWEWQGYVHEKSGNPAFAWKRAKISSSPVHHPQRVAMWLSYGDLGYTSVRTTCGNRYCCNPLHLIPRGIGVFVDQDAHMGNFDLLCQLQTLKAQVQEFVINEALAEQSRLQQAMIADQPGALLTDEIGRDHAATAIGAGSFDEKLEATLLELLSGDHNGQATVDLKFVNPDPLAGESDERIDFEREQEKDEEPPHDF